MKAITFRDARGVKKTIKHSLVKIAWRWLVRFLTTGAMLFPLMAQSQSFVRPGIVEVEERRAGLAIDMASGRKPGYSSIHKFGFNPACSTTEEFITTGGNDYHFSTAAVNVRIAAGGNAADDVAGLGAQSIRIVGLDQDWNEASNNIVTAGASASDFSTTTFRRIHRAYVVDSGTYSVNAANGNYGNITVVSTTTGNTWVIIPANAGQSQHAIYTIPAGKTGYLVATQINVSNAKATTINLYQRRNADDITTPFSSRRMFGSFDELQGPDNHQWEVPLSFPAKTDIWATCRTATGASVASVDFDIVLENN